MLILLDFDGVIVDSVRECYVVSKETYYGYVKFPFNEADYRNQFFKYRGLVRPAHEYMCLHRALEAHFNGAVEGVDVLFHRFAEKASSEESESFEEKFFFTRSLYQQRDFQGWIGMNPLTDFGVTLMGASGENVYIVTTKNRQATEAILDYYRISVSGIYANEEIKSAGTKGKLITSILDEKSESEAVFVDDAVEHLDTVEDDRVSCFFANWGYGENSDYIEYRF